MNDVEARYERLNRASSVALISIAVAMLASASAITARDHDWIEDGSLWVELFTLVTIAGYLAFGAIMLLGWRFGRRLTADQRAQFRDELARMVATRSVQQAFIVTMVAAAVIAAIPDGVEWSGRAAAMTLFAIGMLTLAWARLRAEQ